MVPFLYLLYARLGVPRADATSLAHATSLAVIVPTALRGLMGYRGSGMVQWRLALPLAVAAALSAAVTAQFATRLPAGVLRVGFGVFLLVISTDLLFRTGKRDDAQAPAPRRVVAAALVGVPVGALSATLGVGGGLPATMGMHYLLNMPFNLIPATSLVVIAFTGAAGSLSYLFQPVGGLPFGGVVGHVDFLHGLPLAAGAVLGAPLGVALNKRASVLTLRRVFGALLAVLGTYFVVSNL